MVKSVVLAEQYERLFMCIGGEFPNLIILVQRLSYQLTDVHTAAGCKRGFSAQNNILTRSSTSAG